jgi:hypothetical protein
VRTSPDATFAVSSSIANRTESSTSDAEMVCISSSSSMLIFGVLTIPVKSKRRQIGITGIVISKFL